MKILIITNAFPNSAEETRGIFTYQIVKALEKKCDVEVIAPLPWVPPFIGGSKHPYTKVPSKEIMGGIVVYHPRYLVIPKILGFMHAVFMYFPLLNLVKKLELNERIDLINAHWIFPDGVAATWAAKQLHKPIVLTALGCDINLYSTMMLRRIQITKALKRVSYITAVSNGLKDTIIAMHTPKKEVKVIQNGVDPELFRILDRKVTRKRLGLPLDRWIIVTVGSQDEVKGTKHLIQALYIMKGKIETLPLLILIGDGPLRGDLISQGDRLGISENLLFLGRMPHKEIPLWMNAADVFCLPSIREGHPNVVIEALACGTPAVASNVGAIPGIIEGDNGKICRVGDSRSLCEQLLDALQIAWDRKSIRRTVEKTDWAHCAREYYELYCMVMRRTQG